MRYSLFVMHMTPSQVFPSMRSMSASKIIESDLEVQVESKACLTILGIVCFYNWSYVWAEHLAEFLPPVDHSRQPNTSRPPSSSFIRDSSIEVFKSVRLDSPIEDLFPGQA